MRYNTLAQRAQSVGRLGIEDFVSRLRAWSQEEASRRDGLQFATRVVSLGFGASFGDVNSTSSIRSLPPDCLTFIAPLAGEAVFRVEASTCEVSSIDVLVIDSGRVSVRGESDFVAMLLFLRRDVLERHLQQPAFGDVSLPIGDRILSSKASGLIRAVMKYVFDTAEVFGEDAQAMLPKFGVGQHVIDAICEALQIDAQVAGPSKRTDPADRLVRAAREFIAANANSGPRVEDVARALGVSPRTLQAAFQRRLDQTPYACIQEERLRLAHRALLTAEPGDTVRSIALAHGFAHVGRFSAMIRAMSGRSPREILRMARSASRTHG